MDFGLLGLACAVHLAAAESPDTSRLLGQGLDRSRQCDDSAARNELSREHQGCEESGLGLSVGYLKRFLRVWGDGDYMLSKTAICEICVLGRTQTSSHLSSVSLGGGEEIGGIVQVCCTRERSSGFADVSHNGMIYRGARYFQALPALLVPLLQSN